MKRSRLRARPRDRGTDRDAAYAWFVAVTKGKRCVVCERKHPQMQSHHVVAQEVLRREVRYGVALIGGGWVALEREDLPVATDDHDDGVVIRTLQEVLWDARNGIPLCPVCHERHTNASARVPIDRLPAAAFEFAVELGLQHRLGPRFYAVRS